MASRRVSQETQPWLADPSELFAASPIGIFLVDPAGVCHFANPMCCRFLDVPEEQLRGALIIEWLSGDDTAPVRAVWQAATNTFARTLGEFRRNDAWYALEIIPRRDAAGICVGYLGTLTDISLRRQMIDTLAQANAELQRATRLKDEFLANMSHELRTPLTAVLAMSEALQQGLCGEVNVEQHNMLGDIHRSGSHLLALINDILDIAKSEAGRLELDVTLVDVEDCCGAALRMIVESARRKRLNVTQAFDPQVEWLSADERRLKQMLMNLLSNAVKFTPEGGRIGLTVRGDIEREVVDFTVWDTGIGIAPEHQPLLFQPFSQIDSGITRQAGGAGLGLSLVRRMAEQHHGGIVVDSAPGQGSRFTLSLPWSATDRVAGEIIDDSPIDTMTLHGNGELILICEDQQDFSRVAAQYLQSQGYQVLEAEDGHSALTMVETVRPDLIVLDLQMPQIDGLEIARRLRARDECARIPILALTASALPDDRARCLAAGMTNYLSKPVSLHDLARVIADLLSATARTVEAVGEKPA